MWNTFVYLITHSYRTLWRQGTMEMITFEKPQRLKLRHYMSMQRRKKKVFLYMR